MLGYWNRPAEQAAAFRGDWFIGGDLAKIDDDGWVWHQGRNDDIMNAFGYRVSPLEVEKVLAANPDIADVAVAERKVADDVSVIAAFVVPRPERAPDEAAVLAYCAAVSGRVQMSAQGRVRARDRAHKQMARSVGRPCRNWSMALAS